MTRRGGYSRLISLMLLLSLIAGLLVPASAATGEGIPIRVTRPDERIGSFIVWAEECDESGNPTGSARYECTDTPAPGQTMDYHIPVPFPDHRQDYLVHVVSVPDKKYKGFFSGSEKTMVWTYFYATGLALEPASLYLETGSSRALTPVFKPAGASSALNWQSSDEAVATVDENGLVTALAKGSAVVTASALDAGLSASCNVTVTTYEPPTENATCGHANGFHGGTGTEADPYRIYSTADFLHIESHYSDNHFRQEQDIDFGGAVITPYQIHSGSYDGGYHVIKNAVLEKRAGLFLALVDATIQRLGVENITVTTTRADTSTGVLVGVVQGTSAVRECYALNCVTKSTRHSGGLIANTDVGGTTVTIERCYVLGGTITGSESVGGIMGLSAYQANDTVTDCYAIPYSISSSSGKIGGIVGSVGSISLGTLTLTGSSYFYSLPNLDKGVGLVEGSLIGEDLITALNPITEFSKPDNFAFSSGDWVWREVSFKGAESGMKVPTIAGFAHQS